MSEEKSHSDEDMTEKDFVDRAEIATQKIRDVVKGNLFHPVADVELLSYEEVLLEFTAYNRFVLQTARSEKTIPSSPPGVQKVKGTGELDTKSDKDINAASAQEVPLTALKAEVLKREDKGYFWHNERLPLALDPLLYLREEPCNECRGQKYVSCVECVGKGYKLCLTCRGQNPHNCNTCQGRSEVQCPKCQTKGKRECHNCRAFGYVNHLTQIKLFADSNFNYDKESVPDVAIGIIDRLQEKLITKDHAIAEISDDIKAKKKNHSESILSLTYDVKLPLGDAVFRVGDEIVPALLFGYKCALLDVPPFLEQYMLTPFNLLREASLGQGNIASKVRTAAYQTRLSNEAVMGVAGEGAQRTETKLKHEYSIALEPEFIHNLVVSTKKALDQLTVKPQFVGLTIGLLPSFILTLLYTFILDSGGIDTNQKLRFILDIIVLMIVSFFPYLGAQILARQSMLYALGARAKQIIKLPKLGLRGYLGPIMAIIIFIFFAEIAYGNDPLTAPQIYTLIRSMF